MCLEIEIPSFLHRDAAVDYGAGTWVAAVVYVSMVGSRGVEAGMVALADDDNGEFGGLEVFRSIEFRAHFFHRFQLQIKDGRVLAFGDACVWNVSSVVSPVVVG